MIVLEKRDNEDKTAVLTFFAVDDSRIPENGVIEGMIVRFLKII